MQVILKALKMSGLMNEEQLKASLDVPNRKVTILSADYKAAIFQGYNINYTFEENLPWTEHAPTNFHCLKHVFHPFNYPTIIFDTVFPYRRLIDKILNGHELRIELSIDNTDDNTRLLRLCQCLLGATYIHGTGGDIYDDHYCRPRDEKGTIPVPYVIGKCSWKTESIPAWSYYWGVSDRGFWSAIEDKLTKAVSQFSGILISKEDRDLIFELLCEIACSTFDQEKDIETKKIEGPGYLDASKWEGILIGLYQEFRSMSSAKNGGVDLCSTVLAAFRYAFYAELYSSFCIKEIKANSSTTAHDVYECRDLADVPITGYSQMPNVTNTDLAVPDAFAVDRRIGITVDFAERLNQQQEEMIRGRCTNRIVYSVCAPPSTDTYVENDLGNIIAFKQQLGKGRIIVYPRGMEDCIAKLCGTDAVIAYNNSQEINSAALSKPSGNAGGDGNKESVEQMPAGGIETPKVPQTPPTDIPPEIITADHDAVSSTQSSDAAGVPTSEKDDNQAQVIDVDFDSFKGKIPQYRVNKVTKEATQKEFALRFLAFNAGYKKKYMFAYQQSSGVWLIKDGVNDLDLSLLFKNEDKMTFITNISSAVTDMFNPFLPSAKKESKYKESPGEKSNSKAHNLLCKRGLRYPKIEEDEKLKTKLAKEVERLTKETEQLPKDAARLENEAVMRLTLVKEKLKMAMVKLRDNIEFKITLSNDFIDGLRKLPEYKTINGYSTDNQYKEIVDFIIKAYPPE